MGRFFWTCIVLSMIGIATCVEPTEMRVTIYTDICENLDVAISTEDKPASAQKVSLDHRRAGRRRLGDIVFVRRQVVASRFACARRPKAAIARPEPDVLRRAGTLPTSIGRPSISRCEHGQCVDAFLNGTMTSSKAPIGCGESLATLGIQPLGVMLQSNGLGASMYAYGPSNGPSTNFLLTKSSGGNQGIKIFVDYNHALWIQTCGIGCSDTIFPSFPGARWVSFEIRAPSMGPILVDFDGMLQVATMANVNVMAFSPGALHMGDGQA